MTTPTPNSIVPLGETTSEVDALRPNGPLISAPMLRFKSGQPVLPGQGGFNPCMCLSFLCGGTFTLRMGCLIISVVQLVYGAIEVLDNIRQFIEPYIAEGLSKARSGTDMEFLVVQRKVASHIAIVSIIESGVFFIPGGALLLFAILKLHKTACLAYVGIVTASVLFSFCTVIWLSVELSSIHIGALTENEQRSWKATGQLFLWGYIAASSAVQLYFLTCGYAFFRQIRNGEYNLSRPVVIVPKAKIRRSNGSGVYVSPISVAPASTNTTQLM